MVHRDRGIGSKSLFNKAKTSPLASGPSHIRPSPSPFTFALYLRPFTFASASCNRLVTPTIGFQRQCSPSLSTFAHCPYHPSFVPLPCAFSTSIMLPLTFALHLRTLSISSILRAPASCLFYIYHVASHLRSPPSHIVHIIHPSCLCLVPFLHLSCCLSPSLSTFAHCPYHPSFVPLPCAFSTSTILPLTFAVSG